MQGRCWHRSLKLMEVVRSCAEPRDTCWQHGLHVTLDVTQQTKLSQCPTEITPAFFERSMILTDEDADRVAHYRDVVRPHILLTPPIEDTTDTRYEIHA